MASADPDMEIVTLSSDILTYSEALGLSCDPHMLTLPVKVSSNWYSLNNTAILVEYIADPHSSLPQ